MAKIETYFDVKHVISLGKPHSSLINRVVLYKAHFRTLLPEVKAIFRDYYQETKHKIVNVQTPDDIHVLGFFQNNFFIVDLTLTPKQLQTEQELLYLVKISNKHPSLVILPDDFDEVLFEKLKEAGCPVMEETDTTKGPYKKAILDIGLKEVGITPQPDALKIVQDALVKQEWDKESAGSYNFIKMVARTIFEEDGSLNTTVYKQLFKVKQTVYFEAYKEVAKYLSDTRNVKDFEQYVYKIKEEKEADLYGIQEHVRFITAELISVILTKKAPAAWTPTKFSKVVAISQQVNLERAFKYVLFLMNFRGNTIEDLLEFDDVKMVI